MPSALPGLPAGARRQELRRRRAGLGPRWRGDGREIFYLDDSDRLVAVPIELGDKPKVGTPEALFQARLEDTGDPQYDVTSDGQRFVLNRS